jgi:hypothetical protein
VPVQEGGAALQTYPTVERGGFVWFFWGDGARFPLDGPMSPPIPTIPELEDPRWTGTYGEFEFDTGYMVSSPPTQPQGFGFQQRRWRAAERCHPTGRERMGSPTLQTLQEPILLLPWVCFRSGRLSTKLCSALPNEPIHAPSFCVNLHTPTPCGVRGSEPSCPDKA